MTLLVDSSSFSSIFSTDFSCFYFYYFCSFYCEFNSSLETLNGCHETTGTEGVRILWEGTIGGGGGIPAEGTKRSWEMYVRGLSIRTLSD